MARTTRDSSFDRRVFINFPFDTDFLSILHAIVFTLRDCGFESRTALDDTGSAESRIDKIVRFLADCRFSIHDISRVERDADGDLPRLNMAFECGLADGAGAFGRREPARQRDFLVLAGASRSGQRTLSDLGGKDIHDHERNPVKAVESVRMFLAAKGLPLGMAVRDHAEIVERLRQFELELPQELTRAGVRITPESIVSLNHLPEWTRTAALWLASHP